MARSKRIQWLARMIEGAHTVLDIGTDHGWVLKEAFENGWIQKAIASDINEQPLRRARKNLKDHPVTFVSSDGFSQIKDPFDAVVIAGMGSFLIGQILRMAPKDAHIRYILQANDKIPYLRQFLVDHGFEIIDEEVLFEKHHYVAIIAKRGHMDLSQEDLLLGPLLKQKPESKAYYAYKAEQIRKIYHKTDQKRQEAFDKMLEIYDKYVK